jgi:hypothetical protein
MLLTANIVLCEMVLIDKAEVASAIRIINVITIAPGQNHAHFKAHTVLNSDGPDFAPHVVQLQLVTRDGKLVFSAPEYKFVFANRLDFSGPGAFNLTTDLNVDVSGFEALGYYVVWVFVDGKRVTGASMMLRRG